MANQSDNHTLPPNDFTRPENRNLLSPNGFMFSIDKMRTVDFFCQSAAIPAMTMKGVEQGTRFNKIYQPGDELEYEPLALRFLVDENMKNYYQVHNWMRGIATPKSSREFYFKRGEIKSQNPEPVSDDFLGTDNDWLSDCSLFILSSNYQPVAEFVFKDCFPISLSTLAFDTSVQDIQYFTAEVYLRYSYFDYYIYDAATATDASMRATYHKTENGVSFPLT